MFADSALGHSGILTHPFTFSPIPPLPSLLYPRPSIHFPGHPNSKTIWGSRERFKLPQLGLGQSPFDNRFGVYLSQKKQQLRRQQFVCIFIVINLNFCTNTKLLSSHYSVSLRAKHSVWSRGKAPGDGLVGGQSLPEAYYDDDCHLPTQLKDVSVSTIPVALSALDALCDYALYQFSFTLHYTTLHLFTATSMPCGQFSHLRDKMSLARDTGHRRSFPGRSRPFRDGWQANWKGRSTVTS